MLACRVRDREGAAAALHVCPYLPKAPQRILAVPEGLSVVLSCVAAGCPGGLFQGQNMLQQRAHRGYGLLHCVCLYRRKQKENQEDLLRNANENTLKALRASDGGGRQAAGRKVSAITTYARVADMPSSRDLAIQARRLALWSSTGVLGFSRGYGSRVSRALVGDRPEGVPVTTYIRADVPSSRDLAIQVCALRFSAQAEVWGLIRQEVCSACSPVRLMIIEDGNCASSFGMFEGCICGYHRKQQVLPDLVSITA